MPKVDICQTIKVNTIHVRLATHCVCSERCVAIDRNYDHSTTDDTMMLLTVTPVLQSFPS